MASSSDILIFTRFGGFLVELRASSLPLCARCPDSICHGDTRFATQVESRAAVRKLLGAGAEQQVYTGYCCCCCKYLSAASLKACMTQVYNYCATEVPWDPIEYSRMGGEEPEVPKQANRCKLGEAINSAGYESRPGRYCHSRLSSTVIHAHRDGCSTERVRCNDSTALV
jgi:hypothetical protein